MIMFPVTSSNINSVGYDNGKLYIRFNSGSTYLYNGVPQKVYKELLSAFSHGKYFEKKILKTFILTVA